MAGIRHFFRRSMLFLFLLTAALSASGQSMNRITKEYIHKYKDIAIKEMHTYKIPASITLAQAILESGSGEGKLARRANNHFGIKCHGWGGKSIRMNDDIKHECFRKYKNPEASFKDHSKFLRKGERYAFLFKYPINDYRSWAYGLKRAGYATNPMYPELLINLIKRYKLYQYDDRVAPVRHRKSRRYSGPYIEPSPANFEVAGTNVNQRPFYKNNGKKLVIIKPGDTFKHLASDFEISRAKLRHYNDVRRKFVLHPGDLIYLQRKAGRAERQYPYHIVKQGETLWEIAQLYGIRLKKLRSRNNLPKKYQPPVGMRLKLR